MKRVPRIPVAPTAAALLILLAFAFAVAWQIQWPGLYMDAVNPDYLVVDVLHGVRDAHPIWILPGNLIAGRFPLLTSLYHGTLQVWLALPFVALFGASVTTLRIAQAAAGAAILLLMFAWLRRRGGAPAWLAALPVLALALDPVFVYAFRTQLYIQLSPVALLLGAILSGTRALDPSNALPPSSRRRWLFVAGLCFGLSVFGYFIFAFFAPVLGIALLMAQRRSGPTRLPWWQTVACSTLGALIGTMGYWYGYARIAGAQGGLRGFVDYFATYQNSLSAFERHRDVAETLRYFASLIEAVFSNAWQHSLMFRESWPEPGSTLKSLLLLVLPALLWIVAEMRKRGSGELRLTLALFASYPIVALLFGDRLSGHHFVVLLPLAYLALAWGLFGLFPSRSSRLHAVPTAALGAIFALVGLEVIGLGPGNIIDLGLMINWAITWGALSLGAWPIFVAPVVVLSLLFFAVNLINIGLEELYNPRLRGVAGA